MRVFFIIKVALVTTHFRFSSFHLEMTHCFCYTVRRMSKLTKTPQKKINQQKKLSVVSKYILTKRKPQQKTQTISLFVPVVESDNNQIMLSNLYTSSRCCRQKWWLFSYLSQIVLWSFLHNTSTKLQEVDEKKKEDKQNDQSNSCRLWKIRWSKKELWSKISLQNNSTNQPQVLNNTKVNHTATCSKQHNNNLTTVIKQQYKPTNGTKSCRCFCFLLGVQLLRDSPGVKSTKKEEVWMLCVEFLFLFPVFSFVFLVFSVWREFLFLLVCLFVWCVVVLILCC